MAKQHRREILHHQAVEVGQQAVHSIERGTTVPSLEGERFAGKLLVEANHGAELGEEEPSGRTLDTEERRGRRGRSCLVGESLQLCHSRGDVPAGVTAQQGPTVEDLAGDDLRGDRRSALRGDDHLASPDLDISPRKPDAIPENQPP